MIDYLKGKLVETDSRGIVLEVGGVGYRVFCGNPYSFKDTGTFITVYTHYHVREDAIHLYGFSTREEQDLFRRLLEVSGIGPKVAMSLLAGSRPAEVVSAIRSENIPFLTKLPGIGKKTAQRIILDLKDKLQDTDFAEAAVTLDDIGQDGTGADRSVGEGRVWTEAREGLTALGYSRAETDQALARVRSELKEEASSVETVMRLALQSLYKG